jgi:hypothetical protein
MPMIRRFHARLAAGVFLLCTTALPLFGAERLRVAAERPDGCPSPVPPVLGIVRLETPLPEGSDSASCVVVARMEGLTDAEIDAATAKLATLHGAPGLVLALPAADPERFAYAVKRLSSTFRSASAEGRVALDSPQTLDDDAREELSPYVDAEVVHPGTPAPEDASRRLWVLTTASAAIPATNAAIAALTEFPAAELVAVTAPEGPLSEADIAALARLQAYFRGEVSPDPTATRRTSKDGASAPVLRYFDAKAFTPILLLPQDPAGESRVELTGGPFLSAAVENLASGVKRDFDLKGASALTLDISRAPLAVVLHPAARSGSDTRAAVDVGAERGLTAEEIIARERAWDAGQREKLHSYIALMDTSLRFRIAELASSLDLTIVGSFFWERGKAPDWEWREFFLNGVKWKGRTIPKLPILQPDKVTTVPLDIRLTEEYQYELGGETDIDGRPVYRVHFRPREEAGDKPLYRGTTWIDKQTFALLRRESIQLNLHGDTLSNVQTEYYSVVPGSDDVWLPLLIKGQQVFSTAGRTTAIERYVTMKDVELNPPDYEKRLAEAYASKSQMVRDTDQGLRYLVPDENDPTKRVVEDKLSRKSLFGLAGTFYQTGNDYPLPLLGVQYFNFDLFGKNKQLSVFFAGVLLFANYTDPSFLGTRFDLGADVFGVAIPFSESSYRDGREVVPEKIKHLPESFQVNIGHPLGTYLKGTVGVFALWDNYQRDSDTGPKFVTPVDTWTTGAEFRLNWNNSGYNLSGRGGYYSRQNWQPWGDPATSGYSPDQKNYWLWSFEALKGFYFENFRKLLVKVSYLGGTDLDRFSQWDFGPFNRNALAGFPSGAVRAERAGYASISYGINIESLIRFELNYDQAIITNPLQGTSNTYFSGVGLTTAFNGPWDGTRIRAEVGVPVVRHGVSGFTINAQILKLF